MPKITIFKRNADGRMPWNFNALSEEDEQAWVRPVLTSREVRDLIKEGVWAPEDTPEAAHNWLRPAQEGEVWAGNIEKPFGLIAKVRGKLGRIPGGNRPRIDPEAKVRTVSVQMPPAMRQHLEAVAAAMAEKAGHRVTLSSVIQGLVDTYLEEYKQDQGVS